MFKLLLIWRYFIKKRVALIAVLAVTLLVMLVLVVLSIMSGLVNDARDRNHAWSGDLVLTRKSLVGFPYYDEFIDRLLREKHHIVRAATPVIRTFALIETDIPGELIGIRPDEFRQVTNFTDSLLYQPEHGRPIFLLPSIPNAPGNVTMTTEQRRRGCMVGAYAYGWPRNVTQALWNNSQLTRYLPWRFIVFGISGRGTLTGSQMGEHQRFWYVNEFKTGLFDVDSAILVDFQQLQKLCWMDGQDGYPRRTNEIRIKFGPDAQPEAARAEVADLWQQFVQQKQNQPETSKTAFQLMDDVTLQKWQQYRSDFIGPMEREKSLMIMIFCMIGFVAIFIIFAIFYMIVTEKIKDLGIIKSLGASRWSLAQIFLGYGVMVGVVGAGLGSALGWTIVTNSNEIEGRLNQLFGFRLWDPAFYTIERIPDVVDPFEAAVIATVAVMSSVIGAALPARRAARLAVVDALRVE